MIAALRETFAGLGRVVLRRPAPVVEDAPLPDPLREEMDELAQAVEQRRLAPWIAHCEAIGDRREHTVYDIPTGRVIQRLWIYPPMPENWRPADAPA